jgi:hypothetical protein
VRTPGKLLGASIDVYSEYVEPESSTAEAPKRSQSLERFEAAFEEEVAAERRRRQQLRQRAVNRSKARRIVRTEQRGKVRFSVLVIALTFTVVTVIVVMFEMLAWLMAPPT